MCWLPLGLCYIFYHGHISCYMSSLFHWFVCVYCRLKPFQFGFKWMHCIVGSTDHKNLWFIWTCGCVATSLTLASSYDLIKCTFQSILNTKETYKEKRKKCEASFWKMCKFSMITTLYSTILIVMISIDIVLFYLLFRSLVVFLSFIGRFSLFK